MQSLSAPRKSAACGGSELREAPNSPDVTPLCDRSVKVVNSSESVGCFRRQEL